MDGFTGAHGNLILFQRLCLEQVFLTYENESRKPVLCPGKSTLIKAMADALGRKDVGVAGIGIKAHTKRVGAYQLKDTLWVLDCPGSDSISDVSHSVYRGLKCILFLMIPLRFGVGLSEVSTTEVSACGETAPL